MDSTEQAALHASWLPLISARTEYLQTDESRAQARAALDRVEVEHASLAAAVGAAKAAYEGAKARASEHRAKNAWVRATWISLCAKHKVTKARFEELEKADARAPKRPFTENELNAGGRRLPAWER